MADGNFDAFDIDEDLDLEDELAPPRRRGSKKATAKAAPDPRQLSIAMAATLPTDQAALLRIAEDALTAYDGHVRADRPREAEDARNLWEAVIYRYNGDTFFASYGGPDKAGCVVAEHTAAAPGQPMRWNQKGVMRVEVDGIIAALSCTGGFSLGGGYAWHVVDLDAPFFSPTGYQSFLGAPVIWGASLEDAAVIWMRSIIRQEKKLSIIAADQFVRKRGAEYAFLKDLKVAPSPPSGLMAFPF